MRENLPHREIFHKGFLSILDQFEFLLLLSITDQTVGWNIEGVYPHRSSTERATKPQGKPASSLPGAGGNTGVPRRFQWIWSFPKLQVPSSKVKAQKKIQRNKPQVRRTLGNRRVLELVRWSLAIL